MAEAQENTGSTGSVLGIGEGQPAPSASASSASSASTAPPSCLPAVVLEGFATVEARLEARREASAAARTAACTAERGLILGPKGGVVEVNADSIGPDTKLYGDAARMVEVRTTY